MVSTTPPDKAGEQSLRMNIYCEQRKHALGLFWAKTIATILLAPVVVYLISEDLDLTLIVAAICAGGSMLSLIQLYFAAEIELETVRKLDV